MLVTVQFQSEEALNDKASLIQNVIGIPIVDRQDTVLTLEATPEDDLNRVRALQGVTSVEVQR